MVNVSANDAEEISEDMGAARSFAEVKVAGAQMGKSREEKS